MTRQDLGLPLRGAIPSGPCARERIVVGVISDTHALLRPEAEAALRGVEMIVHAGDIGSPAVLDRLRGIAPVVAVRGNNDRDAWAASLPEIAVTDIAGVRVCVIHDLKDRRLDAARQGAHVVIAGHSHRPLIEERDHELVLNPGSAGPRRFSLPITLARLHLGPDGVRAELVDLAASTGPSSPPRAGRVRSRARAATSRRALRRPGRAPGPSR